jgi:hypothetical protein
LSERKALPFVLIYILPIFYEEYYFWKKRKGPPGGRPSQKHKPITPEEKGVKKNFRYYYYTDIFSGLQVLDLKKVIDLNIFNCQNVQLSFLL